MKYIKNDYVPKGDLHGFPLEIIDKMIERQVEQGNTPDVSVFESYRYDGSYGFSWFKTQERHSFWRSVIEGRNFDVFFEKYPKQQSTQTPSYKAYIKSEHRRIGIKKQIENYMKVTGLKLTFEEVSRRLDIDRDNSYKRMSELELEGKLKIVGEREGFSIYKYELGQSKMNKTEAWQYAIKQICPDQFADIVELYKKMKR